MPDSHSCYMVVHAAIYPSYSTLLFIDFQPQPKKHKVQPSSSPTSHSILQQLSIRQPVETGSDCKCAKYSKLREKYWEMKECDTLKEQVQELTQYKARTVAMKDTTTGEDIFQATKTCIEDMGLEMEKLVSATTDGAPAMVGARKGAASLLENEMKNRGLNRELVKLHCIIHQEALCAKSATLKNVMNVVVKTVNLIRSKGLNHKQFQELLRETEGPYGDLLYHCEVRWLSQGDMLERVYDLRNCRIHGTERNGKSRVQRCRMDYTTCFPGGHYQTPVDVGHGIPTTGPNLFTALFVRSDVVRKSLTEKKSNAHLTTTESKAVPDLPRINFILGFTIRKYPNIPTTVLKQSLSDEIKEWDQPGKEEL
ncbi:General transcription factor II-I repeat domain-containing protein 2A [Holothuria leucospilota]|uniref:General transcription factor II-I repeat domain-containing protein 2A n=1 Tax=Holothuria leucospilota TaxID=206669 RepID=A0A9Q1BQB8_HOLLE|nr:General transcription factor II-I repeat domain-containing protein 2A [Holothuria leucospilota]